MPLAITTSGARCFGTPRKRSNGISLPSSSTATLRAGVERADAAARRRTRCRARRTPRAAPPRCRATGGTGVPNGITSEISHASRTPRADEVVVQQQRALARRRRALERRAADADDRVAAARSSGRTSRQPLGAGDRVELVAALGEPRRRVEVVVGAERDDQHVGLVDAGVGRHPPRLGVDRGDRLLQEAHAGLRDVAVRQPDGVGRRRARTSRRASSSRRRTRRSCRSASRRRRHRTPTACVLSSSPPKPAPRTRTRLLTGRPYSDSERSSIAP